METTIATTKLVRTRLGTYVLDLKYKPDDIILIEKVGSDQYVGVLCSVKFLEDNGIEIPAKSKAKSEDKVEEKPDKKKK
jgi:hypothetical protein